MKPINQITSEMERLYKEGWAGPYIATMSPTTKAELNKTLASVRYDQLEPPIPMLHTKVETRYGEVTFAINPDLGPEIVLGATVQQAVKDQP